MTKPKSLPPVEFLQECFRYDPETGALYWRTRPDHHFEDVPRGRSWNTKYAGTRADKPAKSSSSEGRIDLKVRFRYGAAQVGTQASRVVLKILTGEEPAQVDHKNGDSCDNRPGNLRAATFQQNQRNVRGYKVRGLPKGVYFTAGRSGFMSTARCNGQQHHLGTFRTPAEAHAAWCAWAKPIHGEFFNPGPQVQSVFD